MADKPTASDRRSFLHHQRPEFREAQMDRHALGQVVLRLQSQFIRTALAREIRDFETAFEEILQTASIFLVSTERVEKSPSLVIVDQASVVKTVCQFLATSNTILEFLNFQEIRTGLASGGDGSLEKQVKAAQKLVEELLRTFLLHKASECYPGKESGLIYNEDVKLFGGFILHKNPDADPCDIPDPDDDDEDMGKLVRYWHTEGVFSPLRHVPGNHWHKFFGNIQPGPIANPELFRERKPMPYFQVIFPQTISWLGPELRADYEKYRELFERFRRLPGPRLPEYTKKAMIRRIQRRLGHLFKGWKRFDDNQYLHLEDMSEVPCPEYDILGQSRLEALNAELNAPELAGFALLGADVPPVPVMLEGEPRRYCLEFDGHWD